MAEHLRAVTLRGLALRQITIFLRRKAQKGLFMEEKAKVTAAPTIAEQCGIKYKESSAASDVYKRQVWY